MYWLLYMSMMAVGMGQTVIFAVMPMLGRALHLHEIVFHLPLLGEYQPKELMITLLSAITALTFSMVSPFWGRLSDRIGRKPVIVIGLMGYALGMALFSAIAYLGLIGMLTGVALFFALMLTRIIHSTVMSAAMPASSAYVVDITHESKRSQGLGRLSACMQIGVMCGPILAYLMSYHYLAPFLLQAVVMVIVGGFILYYFPYHKPEPHSHKKAHLRYLDKRFAAYLILSLVVYSAVGMVQQTLGFYFQDILHLSAIEAAKHYAAAMVFSSAAMIFSQLVLVKRLGKSPHQLIRLGLPFIVAGFACLSMANSMVLLVAGMMMFGLGMGLSSPSISASASLTVDKQEQGALAGLIGSVAGFGFVLGPLLGGFVYSQSNRLTYEIAALAVAFMLIWVWMGKLPAEKVT